MLYFDVVFSFIDRFDFVMVCGYWNWLEDVIIIFVRVCGVLDGLEFCMIE